MTTTVTTVTTTDAIVDRTARMRMTFAGDKAKEALGGLLSNDVMGLAQGAGQRAAALTPKGRVIALVRVFDRGGDVLVDADGAAGPGFVAMIRKFVNPRLAKYADIGAATRCIGVYGASAGARVARALATTTEEGTALELLPPLAHVTLGVGDDAVLVLRSDDLAIGGYDCIGGAARIDRLETALKTAGLAAATATDVQVARLEGRIPEWGSEMDEETIPQEANLDELDAISFNKGCYTGQEVVARIHFRGHVNRHLRRLTSASLLPVGAPVLDADGKEVGIVRSVALSPRRGPLAIAMVRREVEPGAKVTVRDAERTVPAVVERFA